ncbi:MAG: amidohydrolase family protein, partial [Deltaproteobacteria bacterium]|nr:amidohydrolase family protein [Deltaproteobacteria bacterium]
QYFRGVYELIGEFFTVNMPLEGYRRPDDMEMLGLASCAEFIYGGCTTIMVIYTYPDGFAGAVEEAGLRALLGADIEEVDLERLRYGEYVYLPEKGQAGFERAVELFEKWQGRDNGRIRTAMTPKAPDMTTGETYKKCKEFAEKHDLLITTHLSQSWREFQQVRRLHGMTPTELMDRLGILGPGFCATHCAFLTEHDTQLIARSGSRIIQCLFAHTPLTRWMDLGIDVCLGTDDYHHDMFQLIRKNIIFQAYRAKLSGGVDEMMAADRKTSRPTYYELLEMATRKGAESLGLSKDLGSLEKGKKADLITINMNNPYLKPSQDPVTSIVLYASPGDVDNVIVDGRFLKRDGRMTTIDLNQALEEAQQKSEEIIGRFFRDNPDQERMWRDRKGQRSR